MDYKMNIEVIQKEKILYKRRTGAYGAENHRLMEEFKNWVFETGRMDGDAVIIGIAQDNPIIVEASRCRYDVCLIVSEVEKDYKNNVMTGYLEGGKYLTFQVLHTEEAVSKAWQECIPLLMKQNFRLDDTRPILERYAKRKVDRHICELCFPIL
jgi:DNA gyrase inhibitor GyrI